jgi:hypothetical protein
MEEDDFAASLHARLKSLHLCKPLKFSTHWHKRMRVVKAPAPNAMPAYGGNRAQKAFHSPGHWHVHLSSHGGVTCAEIVLHLITPLNSSQKSDSITIWVIVSYRHVANEGRSASSRPSDDRNRRADCDIRTARFQGRRLSAWGPLRGEHFSV